MHHPLFSVRVLFIKHLKNMKQSLQTLMTMLIAFTFTTALAAPLDKTIAPKPFSKIAISLEDKGHTITEASYASITGPAPHWHIETFKDGNSLELTVNPQSAIILNKKKIEPNEVGPKASDKPLSRIAISIEELGYKITGVNYANLRWTINAHKSGEKWKLTVSADTAIILTKEKLDASS